jgi:hypothetical protein
MDGARFIADYRTQPCHSIFRYLFQTAHGLYVSQLGICTRRVLCAPKDTQILRKGLQRLDMETENSRPGLRNGSVKVSRSSLGA